MSLSEALCACVVISLFPAILTHSPTSRHQLELKEHYIHLAKIADFQCDQPQPRLLSVNELMSEAQIYGKAYFPEVTVMHRCDRHVGSCENGLYKCGPTFATTVHMPFKATYLEDMGDHKKGEWEMEYHPMENHTSCGCLKYEEPPVPPKTSVHYHYVDPSLPSPPQNFPQNFLPLDSSSQNAPGTASSYDVNIYQDNNTSLRPLSNEYGQEQGYTYRPQTNTSRISINEVTKLSEEEYRPNPEEEYKPKPEEEYYPKPEEEYYPKPEEVYKPKPEEEYKPKPEEEYKPKPGEEEEPESEEESDKPCAACTGPQPYPGFPGYTSSESPTGNEIVQLAAVTGTHTAAVFPPETLEVSPGVVATIAHNIHYQRADTFDVAAARAIPIGSTAPATVHAPAAFPKYLVHSKHSPVVYIPVAPVAIPFAYRIDTPVAPAIIAPC